MFSHVFVGSNDLDRSKKFYDATLGALGAKPGTKDDAKHRLMYSHDGGRLLVATPIDGQPACHANGGTIGFNAASPEAATAWHKAAIENGGTTCEDPPGVRPGGALFLAYARDPDGNKLCALHRMPSA